MIDTRNGLIRLIDLGSITEIGSRVKEFTPMYDRSSWCAGSRTADLSYQVFAVIILLISMLLNNDINPEKEKLPKVLDRLKRCSFPESLYKTVEGCIDGSISDCESLFSRLCQIGRCGLAGKKLTYVLNAVIAFLSVILTLFVRTVFA